MAALSEPTELPRRRSIHFFRSSPPALSVSPRPFMLHLLISDAVLISHSMYELRVNCESIWMDAASKASYVKVSKDELRFSGRAICIRVFSVLLPVSGELQPSQGCL